MTHLKCYFIHLLQYTPPARLYSKAGQYATSLYEYGLDKALASDPAVLDKITKDLDTFVSLIRPPEVRDAVVSPFVQPENLRKFLQKVSTSAGFQPETSKILSMSSPS